MPICFLDIIKDETWRVRGVRRWEEDQQYGSWEGHARFMILSSQKIESHSASLDPSPEDRAQEITMVGHVE